jgi:hypothetical protein
METRFDIVAIANAVCIAGYAAIALRYVLLYDLRFSGEEIRSGAMFTAIMIAAWIAIDFFGKKLGHSE